MSNITDETLGVTAIVMSYKRIDQTLQTLCNLETCDPPPNEILVHVDGGETNTLESLKRSFPGAQYILSHDSIGPGGGRNKLIDAARFPLVASFDDDSYPLDSDFFARVIRLFNVVPDIALIAGRVFHRGDELADPEWSAEWCSDFLGCACVYRRASFLETSGYVPLPIAYGMEEVDIALRFHGAGKRIIFSPWLRVFHDTNLDHHANPNINSASIANLALLMWLRYPVSLWPRGCAHVINRVFWLIRHQRFSGILSGLLSVPSHCWSYRRFRKLVKRGVICSYLRLRRHPIAIDLP